MGVGRPSTMIYMMYLPWALRMRNILKSMRRTIRGKHGYDTSWDSPGYKTTSTCPIFCFSQAFCIAYCSFWRGVVFEAISLFSCAVIEAILVWLMKDFKSIKDSVEIDHAYSPSRVDALWSKTWAYDIHTISEATYYCAWAVASYSGSLRKISNVILPGFTMDP